MKKNEKIERWIDLSNFPKIENTNMIDWRKSIGATANFIYGKHNGFIRVLNKVSTEKYNVLFSVGDDEFEYVMPRAGILNCQLGGAFAKPIAITHPDMIKYFSNTADAYKYMANSDKTVDMICPECGTMRKQQVRVLVNYGLSCPACSDGVSFPNKLMFNVLSQLGIEFNNEVTKKTKGFEWIKGSCRYDFYLRIDDRHVLVEMDGRFHTGDFFETYEKIHAIDIEKDRLARRNGFQIIRIDCAYRRMHNRFDYVKKNIISSELSDFIDFSVVDWDFAYKLSLSSNIRIAADLWNTTNYSAIDIANKLGVSVYTSRSYLRQAKSLNLCDYDGRVSAKRAYLRSPWTTLPDNPNARCKPVALYKDGIMINVFIGVTDLDKQSVSLYGVHMDYRNIYAVCNGIKKQAYGYTMKYITKEEYTQLLPQFQQHKINEIV